MWTAVAREMASLARLYAQMITRQRHAAPGHLSRGSAVWAEEDGREADAEWLGRWRWGGVWGGVVPVVASSGMVLAGSDARLACCAVGAGCVGCWAALAGRGNAILGGEVRCSARWLGAGLRLRFIGARCCLGGLLRLRSRLVRWQLLQLVVCGRSDRRSSLNHSRGHRYPASRRNPRRTPPKRSAERDAGRRPGPGTDEAGPRFPPLHQFLGSLGWHCAACYSHARCGQVGGARHRVVYLIRNGSDSRAARRTIRLVTGPFFANARSLSARATCISGPSERFQRASRW